MIRKFWYGLSLLAALVMLSLMGVIALMATDAGSRWLIQQATLYVPQQLTIEGIRGNLISGLIITGIDHRSTMSTTQIKRAELLWRPEALLLGKVSLSSVRLDSLQFTKPRPSEIPILEELRSLAGLRLPLVISVENARVEGLHINLQGNQYDYEQLHLSARADWRGLKILQLEVKKKGLQMGLQGDAELFNPYSFKAVVNWSAKLPEDVTAQGYANLLGDINAVKLTHDLISPFGLTTRGEIKLDGNVTSADLTGTWQQVKWPLSGQADYQTQNGLYRIQGTPNGYHLTLGGLLSGRAIPTMQVKAKGNGTLEGLTLDELKIDTLDGILSATGPLQWSPELKWTLSVHAQDVNPGIQWPAWAGKLTGETQLQGVINSSTPIVSLHKTKLAGQMWHRPIKLMGNLTFHGTRMLSDDLRIHSGENRLQLSGTLTHGLDVKVDVNAPDLSGLWPGLTGQLQGKGNLQGTLVNPGATVNLQGTNLGYQDYALQKLYINLALDPSDAENSKTVIRADHLRLHDKTLASLSLNGTGNVERHRLNADLVSAQTRAKIVLSGGYKKDTWKGQFDSATLDLLQYGAWRLQNPIELQISATELKPFTACWALGSSLLCTEGAWNKDGGWRTEARIDAFPWKRLRHLLPNTLSLEGLLYAHLKAADPGTGLTSELDVHSEAGKITYQAANTNVYNSAYRGLQISAAVQDDIAQLDFSLDLDHGQARGDLKVHNVTNPDANQALVGHVNVDISDISFANALLTDMEIERGTLKINAELAGILDAPQLYGHANLSDCAVNLPDLGLALTDIHFIAQTQGSETITLKGAVHSEKGSISITGHTRLNPQDKWPYTLKIIGNDFNVARLPEVYATASPNLKVTGRTDRIKVTGSLVIPEAKINIKRLPDNAVSVSPDQVIVTKTDRDSSSYEENGIAIYSDIELSLGKDVEFNGLGLESELSGGIRLRSQPPKSTVGDGVVNLENGEYNAYGQKLSIEHGRFIFTGPVDNPALDIRAVRNIEDVTVGILVSGTLKSPHTTLFSDPSMSDSQALSYLLRGSPPSENTSADGEALPAAALSLGFNNAGWIKQDIERSIGLDDLNLESGDTLEQTAVLVGKQLSPELYISYVRGYFEQAFQIDFKLSKHFSLKAESGKEQAMDIHYNIETD